MAEQIYGQRRTTPYSMSEYLTGSMYDFPGIDVDVAPAAGQPETVEEEDTGPNILMPVSEREDDPSQIFRGVSLQSGKLGTGYNIGTLDPAKYLDDLLNQETFTMKDDGFSKYAQQQFIKGGGAATAVTGLGMKMPLTVLGAGAAAFAAKQTKKNAEAMIGTNGGDLFTLNGATVSRAPGSKIFTGNLGGFSQGQLYASREIDFGFIPGSMVEGDKRTGNSGVAAAGKVSGHIMDAYGRIHGIRDDTGHMQVGAIAAQRMRENEFRQNMIAAGLSAELAAMEADGTFTMNAVRAKQYTDKAMRAGQGFRFRASNVPADEYKKALDNRKTTYQNFVEKTHRTSKDSAFDPNPIGDLGFDDSDGGRYDSEPSAGDTMGDYGEEDYGGARYGGRIGMQAGGEATFEPGFVEGPPENFTERETVADDQNGKVAPDTFIINAAAVEIAGSEDIRKMLMKAYEVAVEKGLDIGRVDRKLYEGTVDVALSKGEVVVPPELAKIIGYDRLRKINNRGKKEVASRQKKAGGGFLDGKKFADGGEVDYEDRIIADEVRRKMKEMLGNLPEDVTVTSKYYRDQPVARALGKIYSGETVADFQQALADSADMTPLTGRFLSDPVDRRINVPQTPTLFNLFAIAEEIAHLDYPAERRDNPYRDLGSSRSISMGELFDPNAQMQRRYRDYDTKFGANERFDPYEAFEKEERYREELRAKSIAYETVKGLLPKSKKTADYTKLSYEENFAKYIYNTAPTPIRKGLFAKYPELNRFIDDKGRFVSKRVPIVNKGVREFNKRAREIEAQRKK